MIVAVTVEVWHITTRGLFLLKFIRAMEKLFQHLHVLVFWQSVHLVLIIVHHAVAEVVKTVWADQLVDKRFLDELEL